MKKILISLTLLASMSSFGSDYRYTCEAICVGTLFVENEHALDRINSSGYVNVNIGGDGEFISFERVSTNSKKRGLDFLRNQCGSNSAIATQTATKEGFIINFNPSEDDVCVQNTN